MTSHISTFKALYKFYRWKEESPAVSIWKAFYFFYWINNASSEELYAYRMAVMEATKNES